jgi:hypothetical protein
MIRRFGTVTPDIIMEILGEVGTLSSVLNMLQENNYVDWVVSQFVSSVNFDRAGVNARVIAEIGPILSNSQIEQVLQAILENDQIRYSWSAQPHLTNFIAMYGRRVKPDLLKRVHEEFPPND